MAEDITKNIEAVNNLVNSVNTAYGNLTERLNALGKNSKDVASQVLTAGNKIKGFTDSLPTNRSLSTLSDRLSSVSERVKDFKSSLVTTTQSMNALQNHYSNLNENLNIINNKLNALNTSSKVINRFNKNLGKVDLSNISQVIQEKLEAKLNSLNFSNFQNQLQSITNYLKTQGEIAGLSLKDSFESFKENLSVSASSYGTSLEQVVSGLSDSFSSLSSNITGIVSDLENKISEIEFKSGEFPEDLKTAVESLKTAVIAIGDKISENPSKVSFSEDAVESLKALIESSPSSSGDTELNLSPDSIRDALGDILNEQFERISELVGVIEGSFSELGTKMQELESSLGDLNLPSSEEISEIISGLKVSLDNFKTSLDNFNMGGELKLPDLEQKLDSLVSAFQGVSFSVDFPTDIDISPLEKKLDLLNKYNNIQSIFLKSLNSNVSTYLKNFEKHFSDLSRIIQFRPPVENVEKVVKDSTPSPLPKTTNRPLTKDNSGESYAAEKLEKISEELGVRDDLEKIMKRDDLRGSVLRLDDKLSDIGSRPDEILKSLKEQTSQMRRGPLKDLVDNFITKLEKAQEKGTLERESGQVRELVSLFANNMDALRKSSGDVTNLVGKIGELEKNMQNESSTFYEAVSKAAKKGDEDDSLLKTLADYTTSTKGIAKGELQAEDLKGTLRELAITPFMGYGDLASNVKNLVFSLSKEGETKDYRKLAEKLDKLPPALKSAVLKNVGEKEREALQSQLKFRVDLEDHVSKWKSQMSEIADSMLGISDASEDTKKKLENFNQELKDAGAVVPDEVKKVIPDLSFVEKVATETAISGEFSVPEIAKAIESPLRELLADIEYGVINDADKLSEGIENAAERYMTSKFREEEIRDMKSQGIYEDVKDQARAAFAEASQSFISERAASGEVHSPAVLDPRLAGPDMLRIATEPIDKDVKRAEEIKLLERQANFLLDAISNPNLEIEEIKEIQQKFLDNIPEGIKSDRLAEIQTLLTSIDPNNIDPKILKRLSELIQGTEEVTDAVEEKAADSERDDRSGGETDTGEADLGEAASSAVRETKDAAIGANKGERTDEKEGAKTRDPFDAANKEAIASAEQAAVSAQEASEALGAATINSGNLMDETFESVDPDEVGVNLSDVDAGIAALLESSNEEQIQLLTSSNEAIQSILNLLQTALRNNETRIKSEGA